MGGGKFYEWHCTILENSAAPTFPTWLYKNIAGEDLLELSLKKEGNFSREYSMMLNKKKLEVFFL